ncbi:MAG: ECF-type sigma factor [Puniceicoccaceae bacterium]
MTEVTHLLTTADQGEAVEADELLSLVYKELRRVAAAKMAAEAPAQTLQPTALVHEAWLRLNSDKRRQWNDQSHFFAAAAETMRRILVDNARRKKAIRHGGDRQRVEVPDIPSGDIKNNDSILAVNDALEKFAKLEPKKAELVKLRYFVGMTVQEASAAMGISERTAKRWWTYARAWLHEEIQP